MTSSFYSCIHKKQVVGPTVIVSDKYSSRLLGQADVYRYRGWVDPYVYSVNLVRSTESVNTADLFILLVHSRSVIILLVLLHPLSRSF